MQIYNDFAKYQIPDLPSEKDGAVSITEESEIVLKCKIVDIMPISFDKCRNQQQKRALRLMKICYQYIHKLELVSGDYYDPGSDIELIKTISLEILCNGIQRLLHGVRILSRVRLH